MRFIKRISERGTLTLPSDLREALGVTEGDIVEFEVVGIVKKAPVSRALSPTPGTAIPAARLSPSSVKVATGGNA